MKNRILYIVCLVIVGLLQSCTNEVDDFFDTPAQQRVNEEIKACRTLLVSSELGWKIDYYPSATQSYGGYAITVKFDDTHVTAASEITGDPSEMVTSLYSLKSDVGPTLNFDTYNSILHYFADPDNPAGAGYGKGYEGDYEFIIQSHSENEILLKGKKTKNVMKMTRLTESSESYLAPVISMSEKISSVLGVLGYVGSINGQQVAASIPSDRRMTIQVGEESIISSGFMYTGTGIQFYQPLEIGGKEIVGLNWSDAEQGFAWENEILTPVMDPLYPKYTRFLGEYTMNYSYGNNAREVTINLVPFRYSEVEKLYVVEGLPFPLRIQYNADKDCMEILTYTTGGYYVAVWELIGEGSLSWSPGLGLIGKLKDGTDNVYEFVDNGVWETNVARALILWSPSGEYKDFGGDTRFQYIVFTKK